MNRFHLNKHIRHNTTFGGTLETDSAAKTDLVIDTESKELSKLQKQLSPLSQDNDPRVKKLKKELEKLSIQPKPKYIKLF